MLKTILKVKNLPTCARFAATATLNRTEKQDPLLVALDCVAVGGRSFLTSRCLPDQKTPFQTFVQLHLLVDNAQYSNFAQQMSLIATYS